MKNILSHIKRGLNRIWTDKIQYEINKNADPRKREKILMHECKKRGMLFDIHNPVTYREKMQWRKLYGTTDIMTKLSDKIAVRKWVEEAIGDEYLIPMLGEYNSFDEIDFSSLPDAFVIKANHGSHMGEIIHNKALVNHEELKRKTEKWLKKNLAYVNFEMQYENIVPKLLIEEYVTDRNGRLDDYKFICFDGKPYFCWVDVDRFGDHRRNVYDMNWNLQPWTQAEKGFEGNIPKPENFGQMKIVAEKLCQGFDHVRVDLYNADGKILFGEMTFTNGNGFQTITPSKYDKLLGEMWKLPR